MEITFEKSINQGLGLVKKEFIIHIVKQFKISFSKKIMKFIKKVLTKYSDGII